MGGKKEMGAGMDENLTMEERKVKWRIVVAARREQKGEG